MQSDKTWITLILPLLMAVSHQVSPTTQCQTTTVDTEKLTQCQATTIDTEANSVSNYYF